MNKVLLLDSDTDTAEMYAVGLRVEGFVAAIVADTAAAIEHIRRGRPDAMVIEASDAARDDWQILRSCCDGTTGSVLPVVVLSGYPAKTMKGIPELEYAALLMKPCLPETLAEVLRALLAHDPSSRACDAAARDSR